jgi:membrane protein DedA with SNARE-associated domain
VISHSGIGFWPILTAAAVRAAWVGCLLDRSQIARRGAYVVVTCPELIPRGERFVKAWGALTIMIGRFFGPLRASVPLVAGIFAMPYWQFQAANFVSAFVWAAMLLTLGDGISRIFKFIWT